ncbi:MAG: hypothetical protein ACLGXA_10400 [Acidobacteriota bacterium]
MRIQWDMPLKTQPEDLPAAVCFSLDENGDALQVTSRLLPNQSRALFRVQGAAVHFESRHAFRSKVIEVGMTPAVAEDPGRSFNATARQLRSLGFSVAVAHNDKAEPAKAA